MKYKYLKDLTSDVAFEAYGSTEKELFGNCAEALMNIICKINKVKPKNKISIEASGDDLKDLLFNWLQQLIAQSEIEQMFFTKFKITKMTKKSIKADCYGEPISAEKSGTIVKAVTNYLFKLENDKKGNFKAVVSVDI